MFSHPMVQAFNSLARKPREIAGFADGGAVDDALRMAHESAKRRHDDSRVGCILPRDVVAGLARDRIVPETHAAAHGHVKGAMHLAGRSIEAAAAALWDEGARHHAAAGRQHRAPVRLVSGPDGSVMIPLAVIAFHPLMGNGDPNERDPTRRLETLRRGLASLDRWVAWRRAIAHHHQRSTGGRTYFDDGGGTDPYGDLPMPTVGGTLSAIGSDIGDAASAAGNFISPQNLASYAPGAPGPGATASTSENVAATYVPPGERVPVLADPNSISETGGCDVDPASQPPVISGKPPASEDTDLVQNHEGDYVPRNQAGATPLPAPPREKPPLRAGTAEPPAPPPEKPTTTNYPVFEPNYTESEASPEQQAGMTPAPPRSRTTSSDWAQSPWLALVSAGLGMAASNSPHPLQAIAEGGLEGITTLRNQQTAAQNQQRIAQQGDYQHGLLELEGRANDLAAKRLDLQGQEDQWRNDYNQAMLQVDRQNAESNRQWRQDMANQGRYAYSNGMGPDPNDPTKQVAGTWRFATRGNEDPKFYSGITSTGKTTGATNQLVDTLVKSGAARTPQEALAIIHDPSGMHTAQLRQAQEKLAEDAAKNDTQYATDPQGTLNRYRAFYELGPVQATAAAPRPAAPAQQRQNPPAVGTVQNPLVPRTQAEIDQAPSGTVMQTPDGQLVVKP
jgi:hypothetical protein